MSAIVDKPATERQAYELVESVDNCLQPATESRAAEIKASLSPIGLIPATESQARELGRIKDPDQRAEVWQKVTETHDVKDITAEEIAETVGWSQEKTSRFMQNGNPAEMHKSPFATYSEPDWKRQNSKTSTT